MAKLETLSGDCVKLSGPNPTNDADLDVIEAANGTDEGVRINYKNGDPTIKLVVEIMCSKDDYKLNYNNVSFVDEVTIIKINFSSSVGCAYD